MSVTEAPATGLPKLLGNIATALANAEFVSVAAPSAGVVAVTTADGTLSYRVLARQGAANALGLAANVVSCSADSAGCGACASGGMEPRRGGCCRWRGSSSQGSMYSRDYAWISAV